MNTVIKFSAGGRSAALNKATVLAKRAMCLNGGMSTCRCASCEAGMSFHPDLLLVTDEPVGKDAADEIIDFVSERPAVGRQKAVIIDGDKMNSAAANALLKTLEEGTAEFEIISSAALPDTVMSRCSIVYVSPEKYSGEDTFGLTRRQLSAATEMNAETISELRDFFPRLVELTGILADMRDKSRLLSFFGAFAEKDKQEFFSVSTETEFISTMRYLSLVLLGAVSGETLVDSGSLMAVYGPKRLLYLADLAAQQAVKRKNPSYTKTDFFAFLKEFL